MATQRERAEARREQRLADVRKQVEDGTLVIRKMTAKERKRYPPRESAPARRPPRYR